MTRRVVLAAVAAVVGAFYFWLPQADAQAYEWGHDLPGYYNLLAQSLVRGQLHLPVEPAPELLALPDPWDDRVGAGYERLTDVALFDKHYYLYHGVAPAVLLFVPWRLVMGYDVSEDFAAFLFCFGGFLFSARALLRLLELAGADLGPLMLSVLLAALGFCLSVPYLLNRTVMYEVAIGCGYFCIAGGVYYLTMSIGSPRWVSRLIWSGSMFGLAIACRPEFTAVFPWVRAALRPPFDAMGFSFPGFVEPVAGALYLAPFLLAAVVPPARGVAERGVRMVSVVVVASAAASLVFLTATGLVAQRYEVDFLPLAVLAVTANLGIRIARVPGWKRAFAGAGLAVSVVLGIVANLALGVAGPYDGILRDRPAEYVRMAGWFSPIARFRPALNPRTDLELDVRFSIQAEGFREPLVVIGGAAHRCFLFVEHHGGKLRLVSRADTSMAEHEMQHPGETPVRVRLSYDPASHRMSTAVDGNEVLEHEVPALVLAPSQLTIGLAHPDLPGTPLRFTDRIEVLRSSVLPMPVE